MGLTALEALAASMYDRDVEKGRLPAGMDLCMKYGMIGICGPKCPYFEHEPECRIDDDPAEKAEVLRKNANNN
jgi:hypothetical protein